MNETNVSVASIGALSEESEILYIRIAACTMITFFCAISFGIMISAPRIAPNIRYMSSNIIFYDTCVAILYVLHYSLMDSPKWFYYRATQYSVMGQWFAVTAFSFERLFAIASPFMYRTYFITTYVKRFVVIKLICFVAIIAATSVIDREPTRAKRVCWGAISLHATLSVICLVCIIKTLIVFKRNLKRIAVNRFTESMSVIGRSKEILSVVCIVFVVAHVPIALETLALRCEFTPTVPLYTNFMLILNSAVDPLLYVWRFRESRLQMLKNLSLLPCFRFLESTVEARRIDIFNIPIAERTIHPKQTLFQKGHLIPTETCQKSNIPCDLV